MPTYPDTRRPILSRESFNGNGAVAGLITALMRGQNTSYNSDLLVGPGDAKSYFATNFHWQQANNPSARRTVDSTVPFLELTRAYLTPSRGPHTLVTVHAWVELASSTSVGAIDVADEQTGAVTTIPVTYVACGSVITGAWLSADVPARAYGRLVVTARWTSGTGLTVAGLSAYWKPLSSVIGEVDYSRSLASQLLSQTFSVANASLATHALLSLVRWHNRFLGARPPGVLASWAGEWAGGTGGSWRTSRVIGCYRVLVSEGASTITLQVLAKASSVTGQSLVFYVDGISNNSILVNTTSYAWFNVPLTVTASATPMVREIRIDVSTTSGNYIAVPSVSGWEGQPNVTLPSGDFVPAAFVPNDDQLVASGADILQGQVARLIANAVWLTRYRTARMVICDSRFTCQTHGAAVTDTFYLPDGRSEQGRRRFATITASSPVRFTLTYHAMNSTQPDWNPGDINLHDDVIDYDLSGTAAATYQQNKTFIADLTNPGNDGLRTRRDGNWFAQAPGPFVDYSAWAWHADQIHLRLAGMVIEQAPLNSTPGVR